MSEQSPPTRRQLWLAYGVLGFTMLIWASAFAGIRVALKELQPLTLTSIRMLIAATALGLVGVVMRIKMPEPRDVPAICFAGLTGFTIYHLALNFGLVHVSAGQASFIIATTPIWTTILAWKFLQEHITLKTIVGLALGVCGVGVMSLKQGDASFQLGAVLVLAAAIGASANITVQKNLLKRYKALDLSIHVTVAGTLPFFFYTPWTIGELGQMSATGWWVTLYLGLVPIALGYFLSIVALSILPANRSAQMMLLVPPLAAIIAWFWIGEAPGQSLWLGGGLILLGVLISGLKSRRSTVVQISYASPKRR